MRVIALGLAAVLLLSACDRWDGLTLRNDGDATLAVSWQLPGGGENPTYPFPADRTSRRTPVAPGATAQAGTIGGPPDPQPDIIVKAFDEGGTLVYCRRFAPTEYRGLTSSAPLSLKPGDIRCS